MSKENETRVVWVFDANRPSLRKIEAGYVTDEFVKKHTVSGEMPIKPEENELSMDELAKLYPLSEDWKKYIA